MKSTPPELSNDGSHDAESELCQKLLTIDGFTGTQLIGNISEKLLATDGFTRTLLLGNISETKNATAWKKYFSRPTFEGQLTDISF